MVQSGGITFFVEDGDTGVLQAYAVTIKFDPEEGPEITDSLGNNFVKED